MNKKYIFATLALLMLVLGSCRKDFDFKLSSGNLDFSKDTVYLDTVFSNIGSSTYTMKVYNRSDEDIVIPSVRLAEGEQSNYRLNIDGRPGKVFDDVEILAKDSAFIFIETTVDINAIAAAQTEFLYTDQILFDTGSKEQKVELVTLIQDAVFLFPERFADGTTESLLLGQDDDGNDIRIEGFFLDPTELTFTDDKPYVVYGYAAIPASETLTIDAGARVHFHRESGIIAANDATLKVNGVPSIDTDLMEGEVIFEGDRLESDFANVPGQWGAIWLTDGSKEHEFNHATIKNGSIGILMDNQVAGPEATLQLDNVQIYNCANYGLLARTGYIRADNLVVNNSGLSAVGLQLGGDYEFTNSTIANYWINGFRQAPALLVSNALQVSNTQVLVADLTRADFTNNIIYGNSDIELLLDKQDGAAFTYNFDSNLIRFNDPQGRFDELDQYDFDDVMNTLTFQNNVYNMDPEFLDTAESKLNISEDSAANGLANPAATNANDILGTARGVDPDCGAYESVIFPD